MLAVNNFNRFSNVYSIMPKFGNDEVPPAEEGGPADSESGDDFKVTGANEKPVEGSEKSLSFWQAQAPDLVTFTDGFDYEKLLADGDLKAEKRLITSLAASNLAVAAEQFTNASGYPVDYTFFNKIPGKNMLPDWLSSSTGKNNPFLGHYGTLYDEIDALRQITVKDGKKRRFATGYEFNYGTSSAPREFTMLYFDPDIVNEKLAKLGVYVDPTFNRLLVPGDTAGQTNAPYYAFARTAQQGLRRMLRDGALDAADFIENQHLYAALGIQPLTEDELLDVMENKRERLIAAATAANDQIVAADAKQIAEKTVGRINHDSSKERRGRALQQTKDVATLTAVELARDAVSMVKGAKDGTENAVKAIGGWPSWVKWALGIGVGTLTVGHFNGCNQQNIYPYINGEHFAQVTEHVPVEDDPEGTAPAPTDNKTKTPTPDADDQPVTREPASGQNNQPTRVVVEKGNSRIGILKTLGLNDTEATKYAKNMDGIQPGDIVVIEGKNIVQYRGGNVYDRTWFPGL